jgi:hypothetical protein
MQSKEHKSRASQTGNLIEKETRGFGEGRKRLRHILALLEGD